MLIQHQYFKRKLNKSKWITLYRKILCVLEEIKQSTRKNLILPPNKI